MGFYDLFEQGTANLVTAAEKLVDLFENYEDLKTQTLYQGTEQAPDDREFNYFTAEEREAGDYGTVRAVQISTVGFLDGSSSFSAELEDGTIKIYGSAYEAAFKLFGNEELGKSIRQSIKRNSLFYKGIKFRNYE